MEIFVDPVTILQDTPYYVPEGDIITLECVLKLHQSPSHTVGIMKEDDSGARHSMFLSQTRNWTNYVICPTGEITVVEQIRYIFRLNATLDAPGMYYCYYKELKIHIQSNSIEVFVQGKIRHLKVQLHNCYNLLCSYTILYSVTIVLTKQMMLCCSHKCTRVCVCACIHTDIKNIGGFSQKPLLATLPSSLTIRCGTYNVIVNDKSLVASFWIGIITFI